MKVCCTQKLIKAFGFFKDELNTTPPLNRLFTWHAHIVSIVRIKTIVAVNDRTFFAVIMPGIKKERLQKFDSEFHLALSSVFKSEGFNDSYVDFLVGGPVSYAKSYDRQVLGVINQVVMQLSYYVEYGGGWGEIDVLEINKKINQTPWLCSTSNSIFPIGQMTNILLKPTLETKEKNHDSTLSLAKG